ncbi:MAG: 5'-deoxynucleotidase [Ethanoligenens sp.]|uniref:5'-deoxynucleotidase n=1 Tax=Ethanoligenens sp. TaxID=2099655 RepID=UPI0039E997A7
MKNAFFAILSRMKYITRWGLMRNTRPENLMEHSFETAVLAHALTVIGNTRFGRQYDTGRAVLLALYHDATEIFTGDMPTPVKYFNHTLRSSYREAEQQALDRLLSCLPDDLRPAYAALSDVPKSEAALPILVKAADKLSALIKCIEEEKAGNTEFKKAADAQLSYLKDMHLPEVDCFLAEFLPPYRLTLDEQE